MQKLRYYFSILAFSFGIFVNLYLTSRLFMAGINGLYSYVSSIDDTYDPMPIHCPAILSTNEEGRISVTIPKNTSDRIYQYSVAGRIDGYEAHYQMFETEEVSLHPGEGVDLARFFHVAETSKKGYLIVSIWAQAGDQRPFPSILREFAFEGRCGIAIVNFIGLRGLHLLILTIGIHLLGSILFFLYVYNAMPMSTVLRITIILIALLAPLGSIVSMLPIPEGNLPLYILAAAFYFIPLLTILLVGVLLARKIISRRKSDQPSS
ncbi:MAG TPA: hypothetical protein G4O11_01285 [Anaerolineae bacterium]|nr:hypothetical protein [Anaerolineae bacterium]